MQHIVKLHKSSRKDSLKLMLKDTIDENSSFNLKLTKTIKDEGNCFSIYHHNIGDEESTQIFVTNYGSVIFVDKVNNALYFNNTNMTKAWKRKLI